MAKRTMIARIEYETNGHGDLCGRLEQVLRSNDLLPEIQAITQVTQYTGLKTREQEVWHAVQERVHALLKPTYFADIPVAYLVEALRECGVEEIEDLEFSGTPGSHGETLKRLTVGKQDKYLRLSWHEMPSGKYEVIGYVS